MRDVLKCVHQGGDLKFVTDLNKDIELWEDVQFSPTQEQKIAEVSKSMGLEYNSEFLEENQKHAGKVFKIRGPVSFNYPIEKKIDANLPIKEIFPSVFEREKLYCTLTKIFFEKEDKSIIQIYEYLNLVRKLELKQSRLSELNLSVSQSIPSGLSNYENTTKSEKLELALNMLKVALEDGQITEYEKKELTKCFQEMGIDELPQTYLSKFITRGFSSFNLGTRFLTRSECEAVLSLVALMGYADGDFSDAEVKFLKRVGYKLGFRNITAENMILNMEANVLIRLVAEEKRMLVIFFLYEQMCIDRKVAAGEVEILLNLVGSLPEVRKDKDEMRFEMLFLMDLSFRYYERIKENCPIISFINMRYSDINMYDRMLLFGLSYEIVSNVGGLHVSFDQLVTIGAKFGINEDLVHKLFTSGPGNQLRDRKSFQLAVVSQLYFPIANNEIRVSALKEYLFGIETEHNSKTSLKAMFQAIRIMSDEKNLLAGNEIESWQEEKYPFIRFNVKYESLVADIMDNLNMDNYDIRDVVHRVALDTGHFIRMPEYLDYSKFRVKKIKSTIK